MAKFFIDRPIFAWVIAIILMLAGVAAIFTLPIAQYPTIAPPSIQISANYPGASAKTVEDTVTQVIEQQMSGLDNFLYMSSTSDDSGTATITLTFAPGTNPDIAQVQVQNKLSLATPILPQVVQQLGLKVTKSSSSFLLVLAFNSEDGSMNRYDLANYVASHVQDPISRLNGVGTVTLFGSQYAMRVWLDPVKLTNYGLTPIDVTNAISAQNVQVAGGQIGGTPAKPGTLLQATITEATLLRTPAEFGNILLKVSQDGSQVRLKDVAQIGLGAENYNFDTKYNGQPSAALGIQLATNANALATAKAVRAKVDELSKYFPHGLVVKYPYDTTPFVKLSIEEVVKTLLEGIVLVFLVMYLFLQNLRATIIPTIAVPVVLLGTFAIMSLVGFSINTLSMFGLVLAIGLLVDDAIVVVENVERVMAEEGLGPKEATRKAMGQITGALVGVALVLSAVFVPVAFSGGSVGAIYRQFSLTIVSAMVLSVLVALILTPALCATILKPIPQGHHEEKKGFFGWFNRTFNASRDKYHVGVHHVIKRSGRWLIIYLVVIVAVGLLFVRLPKSFLPDEDQGLMFVIVQTPSGSTQETTAKTLANITDYLLKDEKDIVESAFTVNGFSFAGRGQNSGLVFVRLKDYAQRQHADQKVQALIGRMFGRYSGYKDAIVIPFNPPSIPELGTAAGFDFELTDNAGLGHDALMAARNQLLGMAAKDPTLQGVRPNGLNDTPQYKVDIDREKANALGVTADAIDQTFSIAWASKYVNNFLDTDGRIKKVYVQSDAPFRMTPEDLNIWYVRNGSGGMVPFGAFATGHWTYGSPKLERYNGISAMEIQGQAAPGKSTGQAMAAMEALATKLPTGIGYSWTGLSFQEIQSGSQAPILYAISILVVFLCLAALYESWSIPFSVIMVVPLGVIGALLAATLRGLENDVFFQVGLLTTVGLSAKNAILIVEFARELQMTEKMGPIEAALEAARLRLRPILMTSLAFILGVLPLAISNGAGSASQHAIGTGVIGGMITATFLAIFMIPMFFVKIRAIFSGEKEDVDEALRLAQEHSHHEEKPGNGDEGNKGQ
ncbi:hydrophobe/amphiphile efflux-1 family RND transporter [Burkholderia multivorans]|uniref:efflux RND transporter permease BpeB n=1 Tax=Burkholderia multivorans TaxID=87883 RepID=UPI000DAD5173|nr:efflux RND transporter permease BpeB [Burkholderia multivorans]RAB88085.1 hydrophobe/amphiphile efflux-1 family RND transporter [Burkholderia multivorans]RAC30775.1 hydrophobe/amphiphile efflux-1 family RND transporter [Burkholderia multivorans]RAC39955.1 hydrophobe/amphiphile efflux-1 family RND transporter [Burkholderia multivorans]RAC47531.1 hydrophobe/amphiphile efflux-1 family RND transporter [Burkholderia multivorans]RAC74634.1 hydrophobe/amphiphile efflux-1 family RND transporter [Bu